MVAKRILCSERLRRLPGQFSWIDHRLVRKKHICGISHSALALYLFLLTVSDAEGLSYYSDDTVNTYLNIDKCMLSQARAELCKANLIAYRCPVYQVLSLDDTCENEQTEINADPKERSNSEPASFGTILRQIAGGEK